MTGEVVPIAPVARMADVLDVDLLEFEQGSDANGARSLTV